MADRISSRNKLVLLKANQLIRDPPCDSHETCQESKGRGLQQLVKRNNFCPGGVYIYIYMIFIKKNIYVKNIVRVYMIVYVLYVYMIYAYLNTHMCTRMHLGEIGSHGFCWQ